ncbi:hypothetical protein F4779DRAFT_620676 [Xylariaceae sp. FL0662B]|nr:hypothetical protein F4779DRAFT_620676 [Xylariaceae sp. FL0662B]
MSNPTNSTVGQPAAGTASGITMYIGDHSGTTKYLRTHRSLHVFCDGPYRGNGNKGILKYGRVLLVGSGIGITDLPAWADKHLNLKLDCSVREAAEPLVRDLGTVVGNITDGAVLIDRRLGWKRIGVAVCGLGQPCYDVREAVLRLGRKEKVVFELEVDVFSW